MTWRFEAADESHTGRRTEKHRRMGDTPEGQPPCPPRSSRLNVARGRLEPGRALLPHPGKMGPDRSLTPCHLPLTLAVKPVRGPHERHPDREHQCSNHAAPPS